LDRANITVNKNAIPFDTTRRFMAVLHADGGGTASIHVKGAPEAVLRLCDRQWGAAGQDEPLTPDYWHERVERLAAEGQRVIAWHSFGRGLVQPTSVAVSAHGVYIGGYGASTARQLLSGIEPLLPAPDPWPAAWRHAPFDHRHDARPRRLRQQAGVPLILRLDHDLVAIDAGTHLEGWQTVWQVPPPLDEDRWQPVALSVLADGDVIVAHDGGHTAGPDPQDPAHFYHVGDHVSRLDPELRSRRWHRRVYTPAVDPVRALTALNHSANPFTTPRDTPPWPPLTQWPHRSVGNTRILDLACSADDRLAIAGWSAAKTSGEPWWSPFCFELDPATGETIGRYWSVDPTAGSDGRLDGVVSDSLVRAVAFDAQGHLLACLNADGGNSITRRHSRDWRRELPRDLIRGTVWGMRGRILFWGLVTRIATPSGDPLGGSYVAAFAGRFLQPTWPLAITPAGSGRVLTIGRHNGHLRCDPAPAWSRPGRGSFIQLYAEDFASRAIAGVPGTALNRVARRGRRIVCVGRTLVDRPVRSRHRRNEAADKAPGEPLHRAVLQTEGLGDGDGYLMVVELPADDAAAQD
ncbi:MAG: hypothetical protein ACOCZK_07665, partial [Planctomycetota bacterium]